MIVKTINFKLFCFFDKLIMNLFVQTLLKFEVFGGKIASQAWTNCALSQQKRISWICIHHRPIFSNWTNARYNINSNWEICRYSLYIREVLTYNGNFIFYQRFPIKFSLNLKCCHTSLYPDWVFSHDENVAISQ